MRYSHAAKHTLSFRLVLSAVALAALVVTTAVSAAKPSLRVTTLSPANGQTVSGAVTWEVSVSEASRVVFSIDGVAKWTENIAPYVFNGDGAKLDTTTLANGSHALTATAYATSGGATSTSTVNVTVANSTSTPARPANVSPPEISGYVGQGQTLRATPGTWSGSPTSYAYQWRRCDAGTGACADVSEATGTAYLLGQADVAAKIQLVVTATNAAGATSAGSTPTAPVRADKSLGRPTAASSSESSSLTPPKAVDGSSASRWSSAFTDGQWWQVDLGSVRKVDAVVLNWEAAFASSYKIQLSGNGTSFVDAVTGSATTAGWRYHTFAAADARFVRVLGVTRGTPYGISFWDAQVFGPADSGTAPTGSAPVSLTPPAITGEAKVGQTLSASTGTWSNSPTSFAYDWERCDTSSSCQTVGGQATYLAASADVGSALRVTVTAANASGSTDATSAPTAPVAALVSGTPSTLGASLPARLPQSTGTSYYVDGTNGNDAASGTISSPWRTIQKALGSVPLSGSIINVRAGSYGSELSFYKRAGNPLNPVTVQAYPGERVVLTGPAKELPTFWVAGSSGLRIKGFEISDPTRMSGGIQIENSRDIEIVGNTIHTGGHQGILVTGTGSTAPTYSQNVQIWSNVFYGNGGYWSSTNPYWLVGDHSIYYGGTSSNSDGLRHGAVGGVIANNVFYDQPCGYHIQVGSQNDGLIITNNTFDNALQSDTRAGNAVQIYGESNQFATKNVLVVNNLITNSKNRGVYGSGPTMLSNVVRNNLAYGNPLGDYVPQYGGSTLFTLGANWSGQNPLFVNRGAHDYHLASGSPANGKSDPSYTPATDFDGKARGTVPDLGAFELAG